MESKSGWSRDVAKSVAAGLTIMAVTAAAAALSPPLWRWLRVAVDPEVARCLAFLLALAWIFSRDIAPRRQIPVRVTPNSVPAANVVLTVRNLGRDATFYASADFLAARQAGEPLVCQQFSTRPVWGTVDRLGSEAIRRDQPGDLLLAWVESGREEGALDLVLADEGRKNARFPLGWSADTDTEIDLEITITRKETRWPLFLPLPRSYVGRLTIRGSKKRGLSAHPLRRINWWSRPRKIAPPTAGLSLPPADPKD